MVMASDTVVLNLGAPRERKMVRNQLLDDLSDSSLDGVQLAISEVVAMFVRHAELAHNSSLSVDIQRSDDMVRETVSSTSPDSEVRRGFLLPLDSAGGYGLSVIDEISDRWGVVATPPSVWFEVDLESPPRPELTSH